MMAVDLSAAITAILTGLQPSEAHLLQTITEAGAVKGTVAGAEAVGRRIIGQEPGAAAIELALARAVKRYSTTEAGLSIAGPLLKRKGFLAEPEVAEQFAAVLRHEAPDYDQVGQRWRKALHEAPATWDFDAEAETLLGYFREEVMQLEATRGPLEAHILDDIADNVAALRRELADIQDLIGAGLANVFTNLDPVIRTHLHDQTWLVVEKHGGFVGISVTVPEVHPLLGHAGRIPEPRARWSSTTGRLPASGGFFGRLVGVAHDVN